MKKKKEFFGDFGNTVDLSFRSRQCRKRWSTVHTLPTVTKRNVSSDMPTPQSPLDILRMTPKHERWIQNILFRLWRYYMAVIMLVILVATWRWWQTQRMLTHIWTLLYFFLPVKMLIYRLIVTHCTATHFLKRSMQNYTLKIYNVKHAGAFESL